jgi:hypothetical protein
MQSAFDAPITAQPKAEERQTLDLWYDLACVSQSVNKIAKKPDGTDLDTK